MTLFQIYQLTDDGFEQSLGYYPTFEDASEALDDYWEWRPNAVIDVREVN